MKYILIALIAMVSVNAVTIREIAPKKGDNWKEDPLHEFDNGHYANNNIKQTFTDHYGTVPRGDNPNCSTC